MIQLTPDEARVLGVLVEKATTTPEGYPLTLNAVVNGCNQKNNRDPVMSIDDGRAFDALEGLRAKGLAIRVDTVGSRTNKYKHNAGDVLHVRPAELVILAELLLRGPQTLGELRGRASRMHPLASLDEVKGLLRALSERSEPLVRELPPSPGSRAERYAQLLSPDPRAAGEADQAGEADANDAASDGADVAAVEVNPAAAASTSALADRVTKLEAEVSALRDALRRLAQAVGEPDPTATEGTPAKDSTGTA